MQIQRIGEGAHGVRVGAIPRATFQVADALGGQASPLGKFLLRKFCGFP